MFNVCNVYNHPFSKINSQNKHMYKSNKPTAISFNIVGASGFSANLHLPESYVFANYSILNVSQELSWKR